MRQQSYSCCFTTAAGHSNKGCVTAPSLEACINLLEFGFEPTARLAKVIIALAAP
jgi:hypothetical protein